MSAEQKRFRITVPAEDVSVLEWITVQQNVSYSIRQLIRDYIQKEGMTDATCHVVRQLPRRGRPPKEFEASYADIEHDNGFMPAMQNASFMPQPPVRGQHDAAGYPRPYQQTQVQPEVPMQYNQRQVQPNQTQVQQPVRSAAERDTDGFVDPSQFFG